MAYAPSTRCIGAPKSHPPILSCSRQIHPRAPPKSFPSQRSLRRSLSPNPFRRGPHPTLPLRVQFCPQNRRITCAAPSLLHCLLLRALEVEEGKELRVGAGGAGSVLQVCKEGSWERREGELEKGRRRYARFQRLEAFFFWLLRNCYFSHSSLWLWYASVAISYILSYCTWDLGVDDCVIPIKLSSHGFSCTCSSNWEAALLDLFMYGPASVLF